MTSELPFHRSLLFRLSALGLSLFVLAAIVLWGSIRIVRRVTSDVALLNESSDGAVHYAHLVALAHLRAAAPPEEASALQARIEERIAAQDRRFEALRRGDRAAGIARIDDARLVAALDEPERAWREGVRPIVLRIAAAGSAAAGELATLDRRVLDAVTALERWSLAAQEQLAASAERGRRWSYSLIAALLAGVAGTLLAARRVARRLAGLSQSAQRIAAGEESVAIAVGGRDEVGLLGRAFEDMTQKLRRNFALERDARAKLEEMFRAVGETAARLATAANEILASTAQQTSGAQQQLAAVSQTMTSLDEIARSSERAADRSREAADIARHSDELSRTGHGAVDEAVEVIGRAKDQADGVARNILELAEQANAVGDITALIDDLAEQTNVLALNAAIEATRAGEHGKGFSVVAAEVKSLAEQSRRATAEARQVLGDVQKRANRSVLSTEESTRSLEAAVRAAQHAGAVIRELAELGARLSGAVQEIADSSAQQATGIGQITQAVRDISNVASQYVTSTKQSELAVRDLTTLGEKLRQLLVTTSR
ncbi:methyl-accepting chemotaxis protein [Anaeromyxobacter sp. Fw109-5]|uniref:methyl-accepting chemotaxis protein n=1 Tax=Anaeromyxobacter sp. (strain Fw109-5) TaxID=404589 RepID=UPI0000ED7397|nr:methyl-accepting chemotaxis protein [Anaeromyxobacter sp. Fw109-5]ABS26498.1 methyl-accepting chemotaxis sensory transducer [Anaeromyxobacter sp. Fw109-5]